MQFVRSAFVLTLGISLLGGLLFVAANTGFLGGPSVLSNMAADSWVPHKFRYLSTRLVTQNGILVMGVAALATMFTGLTLANVVGVPLGTWLGHHVSWRLVFLVVAALGLATAVSLKALVPRFDASAHGGFRQDLKIFRKRGLWLALAIQIYMVLIG